MKKLFLFALTLALVAPMSFSKAKGEPKELKVMSYNIRLGVANDGTNSWQFRAPATPAMLEAQKPDVFGVQEAHDFQIAFMEEFCRNYKSVGVGRENGKKEGEHMSIFWNKKTVSLLKWGTFWLSETPEDPSMGWDAACKRTATWALMKDKKTGRKFYFVNTHLDHVGKQAQKNGLKLIVDRIATINPQGYPMVLTGDFNIRPDNPALADLDKIMQSARKIAPKTDNRNTFNGWSVKKTAEVIDYIYVSGFSACKEYRTVTEKYLERPFVSDHYPIFARLVF
ncbi:MAG: endonuclease/exonuclease/phosphatase family protein [Bacteroidales bacterium]|nr:endonuclease/exonuclease/phosphatase family protein [Bacteroidales bacterium]